MIGLGLIILSIFGCTVLSTLEPQTFSYYQYIYGGKSIVRIKKMNIDCIRFSDMVYDPYNYIN